MVQRLPSSLATVRLMPSMEIEPLYTVYFSISRGISMCSHQFSGIRDALQFDQPAYPVHVALDDVAAEAAVGLHRQFEIHQRALLDARERSALPCFRRKIGAERSWLDVERGQADSTDRNTVSGAQFRWGILRFNGDAAVLAVLHDAGERGRLLPRFR